MNNHHHYLPTFATACHSAVVNGFWSRYLDADDHDFLEYVRRTGSANSSLPAREAVLIEELEFWHLPYSLAPGIERRVGRRPRPEETAEERALRQARSSAWHARRMIKEQEKQIADAELAREQREWKQANDRRKRQRLVSDFEWEAAAPRHAKAKFGATVGRHYVPQWKLDESAPPPPPPKQARRETAAAPDVLVLVEERKRLLRQQADRLVEQRKQEQAERLIEEARKTVEHAQRVERETITAPTTYDPDTLKVAIMAMVNRTAPYVWNGYALMRALGCTDEDLMNRCMKSLAAEGKLRPADRGNGWG